MSNWINWRIAIVRNRNLSSGAKGVGLYLNTFMNDRHDFAFPSLTTICGEMNMARPTAVKYLAELEAKGMLVKEKRFGKSVIYHATIPKAIAQEAVDNLGITASSSNPVLVQNLNHSSSEFEPTVVQNLNPNKQKNKQSNKQRGVRFAKPSFSQVSEYCRQRGNKVDPQAFLDHYEANGWMRGKTKVKDWQACVRTWERAHAKKNGTAQPRAHQAFTEDKPMSAKDKAKAKADLERLESLIAERGH